MLPTGFRRSLAQRSGRTVGALVAIVIVGQTGLDASVSTAARWADGGSPDRVATVRTPLPRLVPGEPAISVTPTDADPLDSAAADAAGLQPSIQYEEAQRHANDKATFKPGGRVTVGFTPRAGDAFTVGDGMPVALPGGRLDGAAIRAQGGSVRADHAARRPGPTRPAESRDDATVDVPANAPNPLAATTVTYRPETDPSTATTEAVVNPNGLRKEIFGFLPYWELNSSSLALDYRQISTIAYFGVGADAAGNLQKRNPDGSTTVGWSGWTSSKLTSIISTAHANRTRVVLTVQSFAWNTSGLARQRSLLGSSTARLRLARQIAAAVRDRGADGVNLDFEPLASGYDTQFTALVRMIRAELNRIHSGYQITFDTTGSIGNYPIAAATAPGGADAIFIMGYDYRTGGSSPVGSVAPLNRSGYDIRDTIIAYTAKVSPSKLILGVPYYGRAWSTASNLVHATNTSSTKTGGSTTVVYDTAADYLAQYGRKYDAVEGVAWTAYRRENCTASYGCVTSWRQLYVDDATALQAKYDLVNAYRLRGAGIWALGYDGKRPELWAAIQRKFVTDTTPPMTGVTTLANRQVNPGFAVRWTGRDDVAVKSYDVQVSTDGGAWAGWLNATTATSATWLGLDGHDYAFRVRARDPRGNLSAWNVAASTGGPGSALAVGGFGLVRIDGLSIRTAADTSAAKTGTYDSGDLVAILAGPRTADGFIWYQVSGPLTEWGSARPLPAPGWVAASGAGTWLSPAKAPNATRVVAAIGDLGYRDAGAASIGSSPAAARYRAFSPNADGATDALAIDWTNDRQLDSLVMRVFRSDGSLAGTIGLNRLAPGRQHVDWNGKVGTTALPDGTYLVALVGKAGASTFANPWSAFAAPSLANFGVRVDRIAPVFATTSIGGTLVSPNGDGILDTIRVSMSATGANGWTFSVAPIHGTTVGAPILSRAGRGSAVSLLWNGRDAGGAAAPDGTYRLLLAAVDDAGNRVARSWIVRVDTTPAALTVAATPARFSPNGDGADDTAKLAWTATERITGTARIYRGTTLVRSWPIANLAAGTIRWTGTNASGSAVPDGTYTLRISGRDAAGNAATKVASVIVDRTLSTLRWSRSPFYPQDGDALAATSRLSFSVKRSATVSVGIYAGSTLVRSVWTNRSTAAGNYGWTWNGRNASGAAVAPGLYQVRVTATSALGTTVLTRSILVDAFATTLSATSLVAGQTVTITFTTVEPLRAAPSVSFTQPGRAAVTRTATSLGSGRYRVSFTVAAGAAGTATIRIQGRDTGGGLNTSIRTLTIR